MPVAPTLTLASGVAMPVLGLGTWPLDDDQAERTVVEAIRLGYRLIDTAQRYGNERGVGRAIRASGVARHELFVTTKFSEPGHGYDEAQRAFAESVQRLGLERIDLFLIHWPLPWVDRYVDAWRGLVRLLADGSVRAIGVSNFKPAHIDRIIDATGVAPHVNQIQLHPRIARPAERAYHAAHGIATESWSPIGKGKDLLDEPAIARVARRHGRTPAQVVLRWHVQLGLVPIPKTIAPRRLAENIDVFDFALTAEEMAQITALDRGGEGAVDSDRIGH